MRRRTPFPGGGLAWKERRVCDRLRAGGAGAARVSKVSRPRRARSENVVKLHREDVFVIGVRFRACAIPLTLIIYRVSERAVFTRACHCAILHSSTYVNRGGNATFSCNFSIAREDASEFQSLLTARGLLREDDSVPVVRLWPWIRSSQGGRSGRTTRPAFPGEPKKTHENRNGEKVNDDG
jgi:hypothetical protein